VAGRLKFWGCFVERKFQKLAIVSCPQPSFNMAILPLDRAIADYLKAFAVAPLASSIVGKVAPGDILHEMFD
jgi:hypothetical protein